MASIKTYIALNGITGGAMSVLGYMIEKNTDPSIKWRKIFFENTIYGLLIPFNFFIPVVFDKQIKQFIYSNYNKKNNTNKH